MVFQAQFERQMRRAWGVQPSTTFTMKKKGLYVIQCANRSDYDKILHEGPWTYRQDLLLTVECASDEEVDEGRLTHVELWVQFHNLPPKSLTEKGINILTDQVGIAISVPALSSYGGKEYLRAKIMMPLSKPLRDKITTTNLVIGESITHLVYEKVRRICCFCGSLGHEISSCPDRARLAKIKARMAGQQRPELDGILKPTRGAWIMDQTLVPSNKTDQSPSQNTPRPAKSPRDESLSGIKRPHTEINTDLHSGIIIYPLAGANSSSSPSEHTPNNNGEEGEQKFTRSFKAARPSALAKVSPNPK